MTDPWARPDATEPEKELRTAQPDQADTTAPFGYETSASGPTSSAEPTLVDPGGQQGGYANPTFADYRPTAATRPEVGYPEPAPGYEQPPTYNPYGQSTGFQHSQVVPAQQSPYAFQPGYVNQAPEHPYAVAALVLGIAGFFTGITFPIAWFLGAKGTSEMNRNPGRWRPSPLLTAGKWIGLIGTLLGVLMVAVVLLALMVFVAAA